MPEAKLTRAQLRKFTVFDDVDLNFSPALNVVVGENGTGKSHLLKLLYSVAEVGRGGVRTDHRSQSEPRRTALQTELADKLVGVFRPWHLGRLVQRVHGTQRGEVEVQFADKRANIAFEFGTRARDKVNIVKTPTVWNDSIPVFFPTRELLTIYSGFVSLWESTDVPFEETWRDTCLLLGKPLARGPRERRAAKMLEPIEVVLGGKMVLDGDEFYLKSPGSGNFESALLAEGLRKFGMLAQLIANGTLLGSGQLFWDEPEANLNPRSLRDVARVIVTLARSGVQVFIATHSLFLLREIDMILSDDDLDSSPSFFGLHRMEGGVTVQSGESMNDIGQIAALDEAAAQADRYLNLD